jgi:hypothetical protein
VSRALDQALVAGLPHLNPRPGFAAELLLALRRASRSQAHVVAVEARGVNRWMVAGTMASAIASAGVAVIGVKRLHRRGGSQ